MLLLGIPMQSNGMVLCMTFLGLLIAGKDRYRTNICEVALDPTPYTLYNLRV